MGCYFPKELLLIGYDLQYIPTVHMLTVLLGRKKKLKLVDLV